MAQACKDKFTHPDDDKWPAILIERQAHRGKLFAATMAFLKLLQYLSFSYAAETQNGQRTVQKNNRLGPSPSQTNFCCTDFCKITISTCHQSRVSWFPERDLIALFTGPLCSRAYAWLSVPILAHILLHIDCNFISLPVRRPGTVLALARSLAFDGELCARSAASR
jgi:hypothetical protein